jgi:hypothetical protein
LEQRLGHKGGKQGSILLLVGIAEQVVVVGLSDRPRRTRGRSVQAMLQASGISLTHIGVVPLLQGGMPGPTRVDWHQHTTTGMQ